MKRFKTLALATTAVVAFTALPAIAHADNMTQSQLSHQSSYGSEKLHNRAANPDTGAVRTEVTGKKIVYDTVVFDEVPTANTQLVTGEVVAIRGNKVMILTGNGTVSVDTIGMAHALLDDMMTPEIERGDTVEFVGLNTDRGFVAENVTWVKKSYAKEPQKWVARVDSFDGSSNKQKARNEVGVNG